MLGFACPSIRCTAFTLAAGPLLGEDDLTSAIVLTRPVQSELQAFGTGGSERLSDPELELTRRTLRAVLYRIRDRPLTALAIGVR